MIPYRNLASILVMAIATITFAFVLVDLNIALTTSTWSSTGKKYVRNNCNSCSTTALVEDGEEEQTRPLLTIVTGFSSNHLLEGIVMLKALIEKQFTGPVYVYYMYQDSGPYNNETLANELNQLEEVLRISPLHATVIPIEIAESYETYCVSEPRTSLVVAVLDKTMDRSGRREGIVYTVNFTRTSAFIN